MEEGDESTAEEDLCGVVDKEGEGHGAEVLRAPKHNLEDRDTCEREETAIDDEQQMSYRVEMICRMITAFLKCSI